MSSFDKLIQEVFSGSSISFKDAEKILLILGYEVKITSSHHIFRKEGKKI